MSQVHVIQEQSSPDTDRICHLMITGDSLPEVWEKAVVSVWRYGSLVPTDYDQPHDPLSQDAAATLIVRHPTREPRYHRCLPMGVDDLHAYIDEVQNGTRDDYENDLGYTYHARMRDYHGVDQIEYVKQDLRRSPHSRRAQVIIWDPEKDLDTPHPPCLQRMWFRIINNSLHMNVHMRSNDLFKATFSNMAAFTAIQEEIARDLDVAVGCYTHAADSLHLYGSYTKQIKGFLKTQNDRSWEERTWTTDQVQQFL